MTDFEQIQAVIQQSYAAISGPAGDRDWAKHAEPMLENGKLMVVHRRADGDKVQHLSEPEYRQSRTAFFRENSFYETETKLEVLIAGDLAVAMSHYDSRWNESEPPFERGVNSIQLVRINGQWKIASIMWTAGHAAAKIPV